MKKFTASIINEWSQLFGGYNWYTFTLCNIELEYDKVLQGGSISIIIFGIGVYLRYTTAKGMGEINRLLKEVDGKRFKDLL